MKKVLLTLIVALGLFGSAFAQLRYETHWPGFNGNMYPDQKPFVAAVMINGVIINVDAENWDALEVAAFVDNGNECRANELYLYDGYVQEYDDPFPILDGYAIYY